MDKCTKKRNKYNQAVMEHLVSRFGVSKTYIRQSIDGTKKGITCDNIKKEYYRKLAAIKAALEE